MRRGKPGRLVCCSFFIIWVMMAASCSQLGWGVLLWSTDNPFIPSGTVLPVYIRSNINRVWVVGVPKSMRGNGIDKIEVPLARFEMAGSKGKAEKRADAFAPFALTYAENLQDGLPIRDGPDNGGRRVYRLRAGEIIKVLERVEGNAAISASGEPLPGDWYKVLTENGSVGYCFSYRLKFFEHQGGPLLAAAAAEREEVVDAELDSLMSRVWSPEFYSEMLNNRRINIAEFSRRWHFDPGQDTGIARIYLPALDRSFSYTAIRSDGERAWRFEGTSLRMDLRSDTTLAVQFTDTNGATRTLLFYAMPADADDIIIQETNRREEIYRSIYRQGPVFLSNNYGTITFSENGAFTWTGFDLLVPTVIPEKADGRGKVAMDLFLGPSLEGRYNGALTLSFSDRAGREAAAVHFMYNLDSQGFRLEVSPDYAIEDVTITRRDTSPMVLYFFKNEIPGVLQGIP